MRTCLVLCVTLLLIGCRQEGPKPVTSQSPSSLPAAASPERLKEGENLFRQLCAPCHPDGGNVSDPQRTLRTASLKDNYISTPRDIVRIMRNPLSRMIRFENSTISDSDALKIAEYILTAFK
jgi:cytochrome c6